MEWHLAETAAAVEVGDDIVILDLASDQYSCLRGPTGLRVQGRRVLGLSRDAAEPLIEVGLLSPIADLRLQAMRCPPTPPTADLQVTPVAALQPVEIVDFLLCWLETMLRFPGRSLRTLHYQVRDDGPERAPTDLQTAGRRVAVFETIIPWVPFPGACLFRSYLLLRFLQRGGCDARWIIGVRTWPFEAHCWLQVGDTVLDDRRERLVRYQPLLAI